jgi:signal transduction histidine kinase
MAGAVLLMLAIGLSLAIRDTEGAEDAALAEAGRASRISAHAFVFLQNLVDAETGQRGFLLTGREVYLEPYARGRAAVPDSLSSLRAMTRDQPDLSTVVDRMATLAERRLALLENSLEDRRRADAEGAAPPILPSEGKSLMDAVRRETAALLDLAQARAQAMQAEADADAARRALFATALSLTAGVASAILLALALREGARWREAAAAEARGHAAEEAARSAAEAADASKSRFLSAASHDLRQPLAAIGHYAGALLRRLPSGEAREIAERIETAAADMKRTFATLLDLSRLEAGAIRPMLGPVDLTAVLASIESEFRETARLAGVTLRVVPARAIVATDRELLESVIRNLLSNAIKATPGGKVLLGVRRDPAGARVEVRDDGPGVPADRLAEIFDEYRSLSPSGGPSAEGAGLGLAIARRLAGRIGARLDVRSAEGEGAVFSVTAPLWESPPATSAAGAVRAGPDQVDALP